MKEQGLQVETTVITVKETKRKEEREHSDKESNKRPGGLAAGKKQRSLDIEYSPVHTRAQRYEHAHINCIPTYICMYVCIYAVVILCSCTYMSHLEFHVFFPFPTSPPNPRSLASSAGKETTGDSH